MRRFAALSASVLVLTLNGVGASAQPAGAAVTAAISRMTEAVNRGDMPAAFATFTAAPVIVEDLAPYRWQGPGAPQAWIGAMGANAQAHGFTTIEMKLSPPTRVEVADDRAYAVVPGRLTFGQKAGPPLHADGTLTFTLLRTGGDWKIDALVWSGPEAKR